MERSGWFDDDDPDDEPSPGPREWRHPSELGRFGPYGAPARRRRHATRLAGAITIGGAGTLVLVAAAAGSNMFGGANAHRSATAIQTTSLVSVSQPAATTVAASRVRPTTSAAVAPSPSTAAQAPKAATTAVVTTLRPVASVPARVGLRVGSTSRTIPAVLDDDGMLVAGTDELAGATEAEAVLADGRTVTVVADGTDVDGVTRLRPVESIPAPVEQPTTWLGVTCEDPRPATGTPATTEPTSTTTSLTATTVSGQVVAASTASSVATTAPRPSGTATTSVTSAAPAARPSSSVTSAAGASSSAATGAASTAVSATSSSGPSTSSAPADPATSTTAADRPAGVVVRFVHDASPAAAAGLRAGDVITGVDGRSTHRVWSLVLAVWRHQPGEHVQLSLLRDGRAMTLDVELAAGPTR